MSTPRKPVPFNQGAPNIPITQTSFVGGEFAPSLYARSDLAKYATAVKTMKNAFPHPHGPVSNRGGTEFIAETKVSSQTSRVIPFQFSVEQAYILEFGDSYIRVYKDGGQVVETAKTITDATQADPVVITATSHGYSDGDMVVISGIGGMTELNGKTFIVANKTANDFELQNIDGVDIDGSAYTTYSTGGSAYRIYEITSPYAAADIPLIKFTQSADVMYLAHPSYPLRKLSRTGHTAWTLTTVSFAASIAAPASFSRSSGSGTGSNYTVTAVSTTGEESLQATPVTNAGPGDAFTWVAVAGAAYYNLYKDGFGAGFYGWIGQANTNTFITPSGGITPDYDLSPPNGTDPFSGADNYPGIVGFYEQRLILGRTNNYPQSFWGSVTGNFENMNRSSPLRADDSYNFTINAQQVNEIRFLVPLNELVLGTSGSEWKATAGSNSDAITPTSINVKRQSGWGSSQVQPLVIGDTILFIQKSGDVVRDLRYSFEVDGYAGNDLTVLSNHLFKQYEIKEWCFQQNPDSIIWVVRDDGILLGLTYYREHEVWGWHWHETEGKFESITSVSTTEDTDEVYMVVNRTIDSTTRRYVERLRKRTTKNAIYEDDVQNSFFVDCGLSLDSPITVTGATQANPIVITATAHGLDNGDYIDTSEFVGMTELNVNRYLVANKTANTFELENTNTISIVNDTYTWTLSASGTSEYYLTLAGGTDPSLDAPLNVYELSTALTEATVGSLSAGEWDYGDNDALGYDTIYVRLSDSTDPSDKGVGYLDIGPSIDSSNFTPYVSGGRVRKAVTTISGLDHLEGKDVSILANGNVVNGLSVSGGSITLPNMASRVHVGLGYTSDIETLTISVPSGAGVLQQEKRHITEVLVRLENTRALWVGPNADNLDEIFFRTNENYDDPTSLFTGEKEKEIEASDDPREGRLFFRNSDPLPLTILSYTARFEHEDTTD